MTALQILAELDRRGVELQVVGDRLRFRPVEAVDGDLLAAMRQQKPELLALVRQPIEHPRVAARVIGKQAVIESNRAEPCWHCHGLKSCECAFCGERGPKLTWNSGPCGACLATGFLTWPERIQ